MTLSEKINYISRKCKACFQIQFNEHIVNYETAREYLEREEKEAHKNSFLSSIEEMVEKNQIYEIFYYPHSPVGSYRFVASNLEILIDKIYEIMRD